VCHPHAVLRCVIAGCHCGVSLCHVSYCVSRWVWLSSCGVAVCHCGVSLYHTLCCVSCWVCRPCAVCHVVCRCRVSSSHSVLHGCHHYGAVCCCCCTMSLWHHVSLSLCCVLLSCHTMCRSHVMSLHCCSTMSLLLHCVSS